MRKPKQTPKLCAAAGKERQATVAVEEKARESIVQDGAILT